MSRSKQNPENQTAAEIDRRPLSAQLLELSKDPMAWMLAAMPISLGLHWSHAAPIWIFLTACLAIIPLAGLMGRATESLAETMGAAVGGLLNATFGNAAELIIALIALSKGPSMYPLVKASITGSIIGNVLLVLGLSVLVGGWRYKVQKFNRTASSLGSTLMALAAASLILPTIYWYLLPANSARNTGVEHLSEEVAAVLMFTYILSLFFSLKTHQHLFAGAGEEEGAAVAHAAPEWSRKKSMIVLIVATICVAWMSELLVGSVEETCHALGMSQLFVGVIVVAVIGNAAEHSTAVMTAYKNKMDLSVNIAVGSSIQIALFVAPILVFTSMLMGQQPALDLHFLPLEVVAVTISVVLLAMVCQDGESHWMEGIMLLAVYAILALVFFNFPDTATVHAAAEH